MVEGLASLGELNSEILALVGSYLGLFSFAPTFLSSRFLTTLASSLCLSLLLASKVKCCSRCSHARGILCGIRISCMGSPFPIVHAEWSLVFESF